MLDRQRKPLMRIDVKRGEIWEWRDHTRTSVYDPADPMGKMFFNILATFAEFEADLIRLRTREGMAMARAKGKLRGKRPKLSDKQHKKL